MDNFDYKRYSLSNLEKWIENAINSSEASPQEIFDVIKNVVTDNYYCYKKHTARCYELLALLNGHHEFEIDTSLDDIDASPKVCDKDDKSPECQQAWNDFWEENYYPEENQKHSEKVNDDCMPPWGHSDMEALRYTEEELNAMCEKAEIDANQPKKLATHDEMVADGWEMTADGFWIKEPKEDKVVKWQLPVEVDGISGEYYIQFPDDLMEAAGIKEDDLVEWIDRKDGSFELRKVTKPIGMEEC